MTTPLWKRIIARILEALLAIIFISPLVWVIICLFSPQAGSAQSKGCLLYTSDAADDNRNV